MSETITPTTLHGHEDRESEIAKLEAMFNAEPAQEVNTSATAEEDNRELSPTASLVMRAATRISAFLERRAMNKAHGEALQEDRARKVAAEAAAEAPMPKTMQPPRNAKLKKRNLHLTGMLLIVKTTDLMHNLPAKNALMLQRIDWLLADEVPSRP